MFAGVLGGGLLLLLLLKLNRFQGRISDSIRWLGRQAFNFCCIHTVFYVVIPWDKVAAHFGNASTLITIVVYAVTGIGGGWVVEKIQHRRLG